MTANTDTEPAEAPVVQTVDESRWLASQERLFDAAVTTVEQALEQLRDLYATTQGNPETWPRLAAELQEFGRTLTTHGHKLANSLAEHAEQWPDVETPIGGPCVLLLDPDQHHTQWDQAAVLKPEDGDVTARDYARAVHSEFGRPDLDYHWTELGEVSEDAVAVIWTHPDGEIPIRVTVGGVGYPDEPVTHAALNRLFTEWNITPGMPVFYAPVFEHEGPLTSDGTLHYDQYGRPVSSSS